jgi:Peptidase C39 family
VISVGIEIGIGIGIGIEIGIGIGIGIGIEIGIGIWIGIGLLSPRVPRSPRLHLRVPLFTQREAECGNTSLKSVLAHLGHRASAAHLGRLAGLTSEGIEHAGLVTAARRLGFSVFERSGGTPPRSVDELRFFLSLGHPVLVGWWARAQGDPDLDPRWSLAERRANDSGHFSVVDGIDGKDGKARIAMMDPDPLLRAGRWRAVRRWLPLSTFLPLWYDTDTPRFRRVDRWYLVVHDSAERFAPRLHAGVDHRPLPALAARVAARK